MNPDTKHLETPDSILKEAEHHTFSSTVSGNKAVSMKIKGFEQFTLFFLLLLLLKS